MISFDCQLTRADFNYDIAFEAGPGVTALFGPSGSGKTTTIRLLAGLERADQGRITVDGVSLLDTNAETYVPPHLRRIGLVFQDAQLLPHLSVRANLNYGTRFTPKSERRITMASVLEVLGIGHLMERYPASLSGGERQRVAIGRALLTSPRLLLMDEPLASLDQRRKLEIMPFIERMRDEFEVPIVYVSHVVDEVDRIATRVVRLDDGKVSSIISSADWQSPALLARPNDRAEDRAEIMSVLTAQAKQYLPAYGLTIFDHPAGEIMLPGEIASGSKAKLVVRATQVTLSLSAPDDQSVRTVLRGQIVAISFDHGPYGLVSLTLPGGDDLAVLVTRLAIDALHLSNGTTVHALIASAELDVRPAQLRD